MDPFLGVDLNSFRCTGSEKVLQWLFESDGDQQHVFPLMDFVASDSEELKAQLVAMVIGCESLRRVSAQMFLNGHGVCIELLVGSFRFRRQCCSIGEGGPQSMVRFGDRFWHCLCNKSELDSYHWVPVQPGLPEPPTMIGARKPSVVCFQWLWITNTYLPHWHPHLFHHKPWCTSDDEDIDAFLAQQRWSPKWGG